MDKSGRSKRPSYQSRLVIMAKAPLCGSVKTRLGRDIGAVRATSFYRTTSRNIIRRLAADPRFETELAIAPDSAVDAGGWPAGVARFAQGYGDLGVRMQRIMNRHVMGPQAGPVIIVGTDIPEIEPRHIAQAFKLLGKHDAVFGPAGDGGYWLVGLKRCPNVPDIFLDVRWSSPHALDDTLANLAGKSVGYAATLGDVDSGEDFAARGEKGARVVL